MLWFSNIWKHPVWASVFSGLILAIGGIIWESINEDSFYKAISFVVSIISYKVTLSVGMIVLESLFLLLLIPVVRYVNIKRAKPKRNPILDYRIGDLSFEDLYASLRMEKLRDRTDEMITSGIPAPEETLLEQFLYNYDEFREGIMFGDLIRLREFGVAKRNDGGYMIEKLAPIFVEYGFLQKIRKVIIDPQGIRRTTNYYVLSEAGYLFYDCLNSYLAGQS